MHGRRWRARWMAIACLCLLTLPAAATRPHTADEIEYFSFLRSLWFDRDLSFTNEYTYFFDHGFTTDPGFKATFIDATTVTGRRPTFATIGAAILWMPFYAVADVGVRIARRFGADMPADGFSSPYLTAVAWGSVCYGWFALVLAADLARRLTGRGAMAAIAIALGTPLLFYMYAQPGFAHACSAFVVALFFWTWFRVRDQWPVAGVAGLAAIAALMAMVREQDVFLVVVPALDYLWTLAQSPRRATALRDGAVRLLVAAVTFGVCFLPQAIAYLALNGRVAPSPIVANKMYWTAPWAADVLVSLAHGWFAWTPLVVLALAGVVLMAAVRSDRVEDARRVGCLLLVAVATQVYVTGSVGTWSLAGAFGQRRFIGLTVCLVAGLAWVRALAITPARRAALALAIVLSVWWNIGLALQFGERSMDRKGLELRRNVYATFVELPARAPRLVYRYLFDRRSFYAAPPAVER